MLFVPAWVQRTVQAKTETKVDAKALAKQTEALTKKISSQRQAIDKDKFPEAEKLLAQIEKKAEDLAKAPPAQKDKLTGRDEQADRRPQGAAEAARLARPGQSPAPAAQGDGPERPGRPVCQGARQGRLQEGRRAAQSSSRRSSRRAR